MAEEQAFQVQFEVKLIPAESTEADVAGYVSAGMLQLAGMDYKVMMGNFRMGAMGMVGRQMIAPAVGRQMIAPQVGRMHHSPH